MPDEPKTFSPKVTDEPKVDPRVTDEEVERLDPWDDGPPTTAVHGETHTRRPLKTEADRGHGPKTRAANREKMKGSRLHNPR